MRLGFGFRHCPINNHRDNTTDDRIDHEQVEEVDVGKEATNGWANDPGKVGNHAQNTEAFLSLLLRQDICDHGFMCRVRHTGKKTHYDHQRIKYIEIINETKTKRANRAEDQTKKNQLFASEFIGQGTAEHAPDQTEK